MKLITHLEEILQTKVNDAQLYHTAFNHSSYVNENSRKNYQNNERLEFLGDSVLELAVSEYLYDLYQDKAEGELTRMRAQIVQEDSLAYLSKHLSFDRFIRLGRGEKSSQGNQRHSILADVFEAFLGATYLDLGYEHVAHYLNQLLDQKLDYILNSLNKDYKTEFQEAVQKQGSVQITYGIEKQCGPAHNQTFTMGLYVNQRLVATGTGKSKKEAEMSAAREAIQKVDQKGNII